MKKKSCTLFLLIAATILGHAQKVDFFVAGGEFSIPKSTNTSEYDQINFRFPNLSVNDTFYIREFSRTVRETKTDFKVSVQLGLGIRLNWKVKEKWSIGSGFELAAFRFTKSESLKLTSQLLGSDTIWTSYPFFLTGNQCTYTNSISSLGTINYTPKYKVVELKIPFEVRRTFFQNKLAATFGGFLACPVFAQKTSENIGIDRKFDENGVESCTYFIETKKDRAVAEIARMSGGLRLGFEQHYGRYWIGIIGEKRATNFFQNTGFNPFAQSNLNSRPASFNLRLGMTL